jgi:hypothetical protein
MRFRSRPTAPFRNASDCRDLDAPLLVIRRQPRSHGAFILLCIFGGFRAFRAEVSEIVIASPLPTVFISMPNGTGQTSVANPPK